MEVAPKIPMDRPFDIPRIDSNEENRANALKSDDRKHSMRQNNEVQHSQGQAEETKVFIPPTPEIIRLLMQHIKKIKLEELKHKEQTIGNNEHQNICNDGVLQKSGVLMQIQLYFVQVLKALYDYHRADAYAVDAEANYRFHTQYIIDYVHIEFDEMAIKMLLHSDCLESRNDQRRSDNRTYTKDSGCNEFQYITSLWAELPKSFQRYLVIFEPLLSTVNNRSDFNLANHSCSDITLNLSTLRKLLKDRECRTYTCLLLEIQRSQNIIAYLQAQMIRSCAEMPEMIYQTDIQEAIQSVITPQVDTRQMNSMRKRLNSPQGLHNSAKKRHKVEYFDKALADPCAFKHLIMDRGANYAEQEDRSNSTVTVESSDFSYGHLPTHNSILQECKDYSRKDSQDLPQTFLALRYLNAYQRKITKLRERLAQSSQNKAEVKMEMQGCFTFGEPVERPFASKNSIKLQSNTNGVASDRSCQGINDYTKQFTDNPRPENADLVRKSQNDFNCELDNPRKDCEVTSEDNNAEEKEESCLINTIDETNNIGQESSIQSQVESILSYLLNFQEEDKETCDKDGKNMVFSNLNKSTANASERNQFQLLNDWLMPVLNTPPKKVAGGRLTHGASPKQKSSDNSKSDTTGLYEEESSPLANIANAEYELSPRAFRREDTAVNETLMRFDESLSTDRLPDLLSDELRPIKGVYFDRTQRSWIGSFYEDRRQIKKRFKVATYGYHTAKALAISVRLDFERKVEQITRGARISSVKLAVAKLDNNTHDNFLTEDSIQRHGQVSHAEQLFAAATAAALDAGEPGIDIPKVLKLRTFLQGPLGKTLTESERLELLQQVFRKQPKTHEERRNMQRLAADAAARKCKRRVPFLANTDVVFDAAMNAAEICGISIAANNESEPEHSIFQKLEKGASLQDLLSTPREYIGLAYDEKKALDSRADNGQPHLTPLHKKNEIMLPASKNHDYSYFGETIDILKNTFLEAGSDKSRNEVKYENPQKGDQRHIQTSAPASKEQAGTELSGKPVTHIDEALELMVRIKSHFPGHHIP